MNPHKPTEAVAPPKVRRLVYIESPYAGNRRRNDAYLHACMRDSLARGEAPYASHALYTQFLDDTIPAERELGMESGFAWGSKAELSAVYVDLGVSGGMRAGIERAKSDGRPVEMRTIPGWCWPPKKTEDA